MLSSKDLDSIRDMATSELLFLPYSDRTLSDTNKPMTETQYIAYAYLKASLVYLKKQGIIKEVPELLKELL